MQLKLFDCNVIFDITLLADSRKHAFYRLMLILENGEYSVKKESGANGKVLDQRSWNQPDREKAGLFFARKLASKLKDGKSPRQYFILEAA